MAVIFMWLMRRWYSKFMEERRAQQQREQAYRLRKAAREEMRSLQRYSESDLRRWIGKDGGPLLMAVDGLVFDVTDGREFYAPGGCYHALVGHDATRLLAKGLLEPESAAGALEPLTNGEREQLNEWKVHYDIKYGPALGRLDAELLEAASPRVEEADTIAAAGAWRAVESPSELHER